MIECAMYLEQLKAGANLIHLILHIELDAWSMILIPNDAVHSQYIGYPSFLNFGLSILPAELGR